MKKLLIAATIVFTATLMIGGVYFPNEPLMWFAGTSTSIELLRAGILALLAILLFSNPPRAMYIRYALGGFAALLAVVTISLATQYKLEILDALVFLEVAVLFGIEALEANEEKIKKALSPSESKVGTVTQ